jgi:hypothetical protein
VAVKADSKSTSEGRVLENISWSLLESQNKVETYKPSDESRCVHRQENRRSNLARAHTKEEVKKYIEQKLI